MDLIICSTMIYSIYGGELYLRCKKYANTIEYPIEILIIHVDKISSKKPIFF